MGRHEPGRSCRCWFWFDEINLVCGIKYCHFLEEVREKSSRNSMMKSLKNISVKETLAINFICNTNAYEFSYLLKYCEKVKINYIFVMMSLKF